MDMQFRTRKMIAARDLNSNGSLFGGRVLGWIDEEAFIYASCQLESESIVTRTMSEINFVATGRQGGRDRDRDGNRGIRTNIPHPALRRQKPANEENHHGGRKNRLCTRR